MNKNKENKIALTNIIIDSIFLLIILGINIYIIFSIFELTKPVTDSNVMNESGLLVIFLILVEFILGLLTIVYSIFYIRLLLNKQSIILHMFNILLSLPVIFFFFIMVILPQKIYTIILCWAVITFLFFTFIYSIIYFIYFAKNNVKEEKNNTRKLRELLQVKVVIDKNQIIYSGIDFNEFIDYEPNKINKILLLKEHYTQRFYDYSNNNKLEMINENNIEKFLKEDHYSFGDFCWVDYNDKDNVEKLKPNEIAELLYLGHMYKPLTSPFIAGINNNYTYLAHDDGYICWLYCKNINDFKDIISSKIVNMVSIIAKRDIFDIPNELKDYFFKLCLDDLFIDFRNMIVKHTEIKLKICTLGDYIDLDDIENNVVNLDDIVKYSDWLIYSNKKWRIQSINS